MANLTDADKVIRNDVGKTIASKLDDIADAIVQQGGGAHSLGQLSDVDIDTTTLAEGQSIVYNPTTQKFENGEVSTVGSIDDLDDVDTTGKATGDNLRYDGNEWVAKPNTIEMTLSEWEAIADKQAWRNAHKNTYLVITDAPNLNPTANDIGYDASASYDSGSVGKAIQGKATTGSAISFTPETGITANVISAVINKTVFLNLTFTGSFTQNSWSKIGAMNVTPYSSTVYVAGVHSSDGLYAGMIQIRSDKGIYFYPKIAISGTVGCTANFNIT